MTWFGVFAAMCFLAKTLLAADPPATSVTVEVLIFSGQRNPTLQLQDTKPLHALKAKWKELPEAFKEEPPGWAQVGFQGFRIRGGETLGLPPEIRIYQGVIKTGHGKAAKYLKDSTGLQQVLINESKKQPLEERVKAAIDEYESAQKAARK